MAGSLDMYKDLLTPIKDPEKSFAVNISQLLQDYVANLVSGKTAPNFNSAALILQGSSSIYGKKVEYLHNLATQLCNNLLKQQTKDTEAPAKKETKEKEKKEEKSNDPFMSIEIKPGKNLSCLRRKNTSKKEAAKKPVKKVKSSVIPVNLLTTDSEDKGDLFYDTRGEAIGNMGDYALNRCKLTPEGWLLVSTVNPKLVPSPDVVPDYYNNSNMPEQPSSTVQATPCETENNLCSDDFAQASPDEGFGTDPASNDILGSDLGTAASSQQNSTEPPTPNNPESSLVDEGIGGTPSDDIEVCPSPGSSDGIENIPADILAIEIPDPSLIPVREAIRRALKPCQLLRDIDDLPSLKTHLMIRRKIQKKNTCRLPEKLKSADSSICCISDFCARTYFSMDNKHLMNSMLYFDAVGFDNNSKFVKRMIERINILKNNKKNKKIDPIEDMREINVEDVESLKDADEGDNLFVPFDDGDIQIDNDPKIPRATDAAANMAVDVCIPEEPVELPSPDISHIAHEEHSNYLREVQQFVQNSDITENVHAWEQSVKPFLEELDHRESFDINLYGSRILNSFEDNNRKQTKTFRQFCKNKEKWEIHRYFMALLPLANVGNVSIESERKEDGSDEIFVTLLSRKMHHKELEEFGHNDGSHP